MAGESQQVPGSSPDPTVITTENIDKAIAQSEKLTDAKLNVAKAEGLALHNICIEKFKSMESTFGLVERQRVEQKKDTKDAVDAALAAAKENNKQTADASKEAIAKSEGNTGTRITGLEKNVADLKEEVGKVRNLAQGAESQRDRQRLSQGTLVAAVVAAVVVVNTLIALLPNNGG